MNKLHFVLFTLAALCLFSAVQSQTSGGYFKDTNTIAATGDITVNITIYAAVNVSSSDGSGPCTNYTENAADVISRFNSTLPIPASALNVTANNATDTTVIVFYLAFKNNDTSINQTHSNIVQASNSTNATAQVDFFKNKITYALNNAFNNTLSIYGCNLTVFWVNGIAVVNSTSQPTTPPTHAPTVTGSTSAHPTTTTNTTTSSAPHAPGLSLSLLGGVFFLLASFF